MVELEEHFSTEAKFRAIVLQLSIELSGQPVALPLKRIAGHLGCDWTLIRRYRQRAVDTGMIRKVGRAIPHLKAAMFVLCDR